MASSIPSASVKGFQDGSTYDQHRPSYPQEAVDSLLKHLQVAGLEGARIVDLAAGTGKFTELLANRHEWFDIIAVEPHDGMRVELEKKSLGGVRALKGEATNMRGVESQSIDAVVAAQAFHWFANMEALQEIYRVLIPGGVFGMIWNVEDYNAPESWVPATKWEAKLKDITWASGNDNPRFRHSRWREVFDKQLESTPLTIQTADPLFSLPIGEETIEFTHWLSPDAIWDRFHTLSQFAVLEGQQLLVSSEQGIFPSDGFSLRHGKDVKRQFDEAMAVSDTHKNEHGEFPVHGRTYIAWTTAVPGAPLREGG